jgi:hypothetical protein
MFCADRQEKAPMKWIALLFPLLMLAGPAWAQETKMHRKDAGQVDKTGWTLAESTEGRFSVYMPMKFNDFTTIERYPSPVERAYHVGGRSADEIALQATRIVYRKGAATAQEYFARFAKGEGFGLKPEQVSSTRRVGDMRMVDLRFKQTGSVRYQRIILLESDLMMLSIETPPAHADIARKLAERFFDSLLVDPK